MYSLLYISLRLRAVYTVQCTSVHSVHTVPIKGGSSGQGSLPIIVRPWESQQQGLTLTNKHIMIQTQWSQ